MLHPRWADERNGAIYDMLVASRLFSTQYHFTQTLQVEDAPLSGRETKGCQAEQCLGLRNGYQQRWHLFLECGGLWVFFAIVIELFFQLRNGLGSL